MITLISKALKPYKQIRYLNEYCQHSNTLTFGNDTKENKSNYFYRKLIIRKAKPMTKLKKWNEVFNKDISWKNVYFIKVKNQPEVKHAEFNFKIISDILATNNKLHKWRKSDTSECIYCSAEHTPKHLLNECIHVKPLWQKLHSYFRKCVTWFDIITGGALTNNQNIVVTLLCFEVYKKFLVDRTSPELKEDILIYIKRQLKCLSIRYSYITSLTTLVMAINTVIEIIEE